MLAQLFFQFIIGNASTFEGYEGDDRRAFQIIRLGDDRCFGDSLVRNQRAFDFRRTQTVSGDIDHVVDATHDPEVTVLILASAVAGKIYAIDLRPVLLSIAS